MRCGRAVDSSGGCHRCSSLLCADNELQEKGVMWGRRNRLPGLTEVLLPILCARITLTCC